MFSSTWKLPQTAIVRRSTSSNFDGGQVPIQDGSTLSLSSSENNVIINIRNGNRSVIHHRRKNPAMVVFRKPDRQTNGSSNFPSGDSRIVALSTMNIATTKSTYRLGSTETTFVVKRKRSTSSGSRNSDDYHQQKHNKEENFLPSAECSSKRERCREGMESLPNISISSSWLSTISKHAIKSINVDGTTNSNLDGPIRVTNKKRNRIRSSSGGRCDRHRKSMISASASDLTCSPTIKFGRLSTSANPLVRLMILTSSLLISIIIGSLSYRHDRIVDAFTIHRHVWLIPIRKTASPTLAPPTPPLSQSPHSSQRRSSPPSLMQLQYTQFSTQPSSRSNMHLMDRNSKLLSSTSALSLLSCSKNFRYTIDQLANHFTDVRVRRRTMCTTRLWSSEIMVDIDPTILASSRASSAGDNASRNGVDVTNDSVNSSRDVPRPTPNGGFTHTPTSKAKISAANKGKVPWNKGKSRSEEDKARIAAGVRARNREIFLKKLQDLGLTEEEYEDYKKEQRRQRERERRARKTAKGGYKPTEETKKKISEIMKEKHRRGEVKRPKRPSRTGYSPSPETRKKISESLKKKWAEDEEYRERITANLSSSRDEDYRKKMSEIMKKKWQDPDEREKMLKKQTRAPRSPEHRRKVSEAIKKKWQDPEYRKRVGDGMKKKWENDANYRMAVSSTMSESIKKKWQDAEYRDRVVSTKKKASAKRKDSNTTLSSNRRTRKVKGSTSSGSNGDPFELEIVLPVSVNDAVKRKEKKLKQKRKQKKLSTAKSAVDDSSSMMIPSLVDLDMEHRTMTASTKVRGDDLDVSLYSDLPSAESIVRHAGKNKKQKRTKKKMKKNIPSETSATSAAKSLPYSSFDSTATSTTLSKKKKRKRKKEKDGSVSRLREERRDLFELLYGDDDDDDINASAEEIRYGRQDETAHSEAVGNVVTLDGDGVIVDDIVLDDQPGINIISSPSSATSAARPGSPSTLNGETEDDSDVSQLQLPFNDKATPPIIKSLLDDDDLDSFDPYGLDDY